MTLHAVEGLTGVVPAAKPQDTTSAPSYFNSPKRPWKDPRLLRNPRVTLVKRDLPLITQRYSEPNNPSTDQLRFPLPGLYPTINAAHYSRKTPSKQ